MPEILQSALTPLAILIGVIVNYRLLSQGLEQLRKATEARRESEDKRHEESMKALNDNHAATMTALRELIRRTGLTSRPT